MKGRGLVPVLGQSGRAQCTGHMFDWTAGCSSQDLSQSPFPGHLAEFQVLSFSGANRWVSPSASVLFPEERQPLALL